MDCRLCGKPAKIVKSHIIPEFYYKSLYDHKHRFFTIDIDSSVNNTFLQKGLREKLLCQTCESNLSRYEEYVYDVIYNKKPNGVILKDNVFQFNNINYSYIRLCYLSILWRMSVSSLDFFKDVKLGPHESRIKDMIVHKNPGEPNQYGFLCIAPIINGKIYSGWISQPDKVRANGHSAYRIVIGGLLYVFFISRHNLPTTVTERFVQKAGCWIIDAKDARHIPLIDSLFSEACKAQNTRKIKGKIGEGSKNISMYGPESASPY